MLHGVTFERSLRARAAAYGARRLVRSAIEELETGTAQAPLVQQYGFDLEVCTAATMRAAAAFAAGAGVDQEGTWPLAVSVLARMNLQLWQYCPRTSITEYLILVDTIEDKLTDVVLQRNAALDGRHYYGDEDGMVARTSSVDEAVALALDLVGQDFQLAMHTLIAVSLRAMSEAA